MGIENNAKKHLERKSTMKKKRILALALALCMSLMLAACGGTPTNSDPAETGSGDDNASTTKTLTMAIAAETTTLSPLYMGNANMCTDRGIRPGCEGGPARACGCAGPPSFFFVRIVALLRAAGDNIIRNEVKADVDI